MINIYTDNSLLIPENRGIVHPLIFDLHYFENVHRDVLDHYNLVQDPSSADVFVFPINYSVHSIKGYGKQYKNFCELALKYHKRIMVYTGGDYGKSFNDDSIIVWRNAGFKTKNDKYTVIIPAFIDDPLEREGMGSKTLAYSEQPQICFTGFATNSLKESLRVALATWKGNVSRILKKDNTDKQRLFNAAKNRFCYLKQLEKSNLIKTDFIYRKKYRAGATTDQDRKRTTTEFYENLNSSPYTFCLRGAGNFSVRFYESLACGRIPVLIDTDCSLPLENVIPWDKHICHIGKGEDLITKLISFHKGHNNDTFKQLQASNRALYEDYLVRDRFFCNLHSGLKNIL